MRLRAPLRVLQPVLLLSLLSACSEFRYKPLYTSPVEEQREAAKTIAPAKLGGTTAEGDAPTEQRSVRVRVYANRDFRAQTLRWEEAVRLQLERASSFTQPRYGVTFVVESLRAWEHSGSAPLESVLDELARHDSGDDVDLVLGYATALPVFTASQHQLGMARILGNHAVLRSMENPEEARAIAEGLHLLGEEERARLIRERRLHKEVSVFLHEWAHTLGAVHVEAHDSLMFPSYDAQQASFGPAHGPVALGVGFQGRARLDAEARGAWRDALRALATSEQSAAWDRVERERLVADLGGTPAAAPPVALRTNVPSRLTSSDRMKLSRVLTFAKTGNLTEAYSVLGDLPHRYPDELDVQLVACELAVQKAPRELPPENACTLAAKLAPELPWPWLLLARAQVERKEAAAAQESVKATRTRLEQHAGAPPEVWAELAAVCSRLFLVTWAEQAAARAPRLEQSTQVQAWAAQVRRVLALPRDLERSGVAPEQEATYALAVQSGLQDAEMGLATQARIRAASLRKSYPKAPGASLLECVVAARAGRAAQARPHCEGVLKQAPEAVNVHLMLAAAEAGTGKLPSATRRAEKALELEPDQQSTWEMLARLYEAQGKRKQLTDLRKRYRERFGAELR